MSNQILVNEEWVDGDPTEEGQEYRIKIPVGTGFGYEGRKHTLAPQSPTKPVPWSTLESLMGDIIITELNAIRDRNITTPVAVRRAVIELLNDMHSDKTFDAFGQEITPLLTAMVATPLLTFDQATALAILTELQS